MNMYVQGYASVWNQWSQDLGGFRERIAPNALGWNADDDVTALLNHSRDTPYARFSTHGLFLRNDATGLRYAFAPPNTTAGRDLVELVRGKIINKSSFAFVPESDDWDVSDDGGVTSTITSALVVDVSPVTSPAYRGTSVELADGVAPRAIPPGSVLAAAVREQQAELVVGDGVLGLVLREAEVTDDPEHRRRLTTWCVGEMRRLEWDVKRLRSGDLKDFMRPRIRRENKPTWDDLIRRRTCAAYAARARACELGA